MFHGPRRRARLADQQALGRDAQLRLCPRTSRVLRRTFRSSRPSSNRTLDTAAPFAEATLAIPRAPSISSPHTSCSRTRGTSSPKRKSRAWSPLRFIPTAKNPSMSGSAKPGTCLRIIANLRPGNPSTCKLAPTRVLTPTSPSSGLKPLNPWLQNSHQPTLRSKGGFFISATEIRTDGNQI